MGEMVYGVSMCEKFGFNLWIDDVKSLDWKSNFDEDSVEEWIFENFDTKNDTFENYGEGNLKDVSASFVVASNIVLGLLASKGITDIVIPSILIERWNAKETGIIVKSKKEENKEEFITSNTFTYFQEAGARKEKQEETASKIIKSNTQPVSHDTETKKSDDDYHFVDTLAIIQNVAFKLEETPAPKLHWWNRFGIWLSKLRRK